MSSGAPNPSSTDDLPYVPTSTEPPVFNTLPLEKARRLCRLLMTSGTHHFAQFDLLRHVLGTCMCNSLAINLGKQTKVLKSIFCFGDFRFLKNRKIQKLRQMPLC